VIVGLHAPVLWRVQAASGWPFFWPGLVALASYYGLYEYLHWCMHNPVGRRIERTGIFRYLDANHRLHHACWRLNFNVVCPLADIVLGTYRARSAPGSPRLFDNSHLPSLPSERSLRRSFEILRQTSFGFTQDRLLHIQALIKRPNFEGTRDHTDALTRNNSNSGRWRQLRGGFSARRVRISGQLNFAGR